MHHSFDVHLATKFGVEAAILIHHFQHWVGVNKRLDRNYHEGKWWSYQTMTFIQSTFPYWSRDQIRRLLKTLLDEGVLVKDSFSTNVWDRTVWYAFADDKVFIKEVEVDTKLAEEDKKYAEQLRMHLERSIAKDMEGGGQPPHVATPPHRSMQNRKTELAKTPNGVVGTATSPYISNTKTSSYLDDDDAREKTPALGCGNVHNSNLELVNTRGEKVACSTEEYFRYCVNTRKDFSLEEVNEAWKRLERFNGAIGDWKAYLDQIIINKRNENRCNLQTKKKKNMICAEKNTSESSNAKTSETTLKEPPSPKVRLPLANPIKKLS